MRKAQPLVGPLGYTDEDMASDRRGRAQVRTQNPAIQDILRRLSGGVGYQGNTPGDKVMVMQDYGAEPNFGSFNPFKLDDPMNESAIAQAEMARVGVDRAGPMGLDGMSDRFKRPPSRFGNSYGGFGIPRIEMGMGDNSKLLGGSPPSTKVIDPYYERRKRQFSDRATMKRPKAKPRVRKSTAFDQAWALLKAVEFNTQAKRGSRPFKAYRAIPRKYLDEVLSEGLFPRDASQWRMKGIPDVSEREKREMRRAADEGRISRDEYYQFLTDSMEYPTGDKALWTFMHQRGYGPSSNALARMRRDNPYSSRSHPALAARYFGDRFMTVPAEDFNIETGRNADNVAIVGSKIAPPGKRFIDTDFEPMETAAKPTISFEPIEPRHLDEAIPIDYRGRELRYTRGSEIPDVLRDDWGYDE